MPKSILFFDIQDRLVSDFYGSASSQFKDDHSLVETNSFTSEKTDDLISKYEAVVITDSAISAPLSQSKHFLNEEKESEDSTKKNKKSKQNIILKLRDFVSSGCKLIILAADGDTKVPGMLTEAFDTDWVFQESGRYAYDATLAGVCLFKGSNCKPSSIPYSKHYLLKVPKSDAMYTQKIQPHRKDSDDDSDDQFNAPRNIL